MRQMKHVPVFGMYKILIPHQETGYDLIEIYTSLGYIVSQNLLNLGHVFCSRIVTRLTMRKRNTRPKSKRFCETI